MASGQLGLLRSRPDTSNNCGEQSAGIPGRLPSDPYYQEYFTLPNWGVTKIGEMRCGHCASAQTVKDGKNGSGSQRYKCKTCGKHFTPQPNEIGYPLAVRQQAVEMVVDGQNYRRTGRNLRVNHQSVANWVKAAAQKALGAPLPRPVVDDDTVVEVDELFTFVQAKKTKRSSSRKSTGKHAVS